MRGARAAQAVLRGTGSHTFRQLSSAAAGPAKDQTAFDEVIFSGIQPTGTPHLGNYLGFCLPFLDLQQTAQPTTPIYLSIVGLHAITMARDPAVLRQDRRDMMAALIACGVNPERTCLFFQEDVPEHAELAWVLNTLTPVGRLQRMTTWKSQLATRAASSVDDVSEADLKLGLLAYPVLQAADILLYKATTVPVGDDQSQHLELTRVIADSFNRQFPHGPSSPSSYSSSPSFSAFPSSSSSSSSSSRRRRPTFPIPQAKIVPSARILNLRDPLSKMSKSHPNPSSRILLTDSPGDIAAKIKSAVTDSQRSITYDPETRPGVANLLLIWSALGEAGNGGRSPEELAREATEQGWGMGKLKEVIAEVVVEKLRPVREGYERLRAEQGYLAEVSRKGRLTARENAAKTMDEVRRIIGLDLI